MIDTMRRLFGKQSDLILVLGVIGILMVLFMPIPAGLLDFLLITNLSFALLTLLLTFYVEKPLQFSTFPSLLLIATLFRLSLNIAATRLILSDADAGRVISTIGSHVVGGNYVIGMIVFIVLIVVQYVVVTNGAQRVAEVAARFTLDGMPGKQMSIDADLNMGLINEQQAQERRKNIEKEANFYGAMDGASKFVKGDAIAGIIIILIDIIGGLTIGVAQLNMSWGDALQTYTLLTVGDGIVTQIPALVIATGTGIIVTRATSDEFLSKEISRQITAYPKILGLISIALIVALFIPGIPAFPVLLLLIVVGSMFFVARRIKQQRESGEAEVEADQAAASDDNIYDMLSVDALEITVGQNLITMFGGDDSLVMDRIAAFRKQYAMEVGFVMPKVRAKDDKKLPPQSYQIKAYGARVGEGEILADRLLAINPGDASSELEGIETQDPTYGLPAVWVPEQSRQLARDAGYTIVEPINVLMTHLTEVVRQQSPNLLTRSETERLVGRVKEQDATLIDELIPNVLSLTDVQKVLQGLLREKVSIRNMELILEVLVDAGKQSKDPEILTELVRQKLGALICQTLAARDGSLKVLVLDPTVEQAFISGMRGGERPQLVLEPRMAEQVLKRMTSEAERMMESDESPVLLCAPELRRHVKRFTERVIPHLSVLSMSEVPPTFDVKSFGMVAL